MTPAKPIGSAHSANMGTTVIFLALLFLPGLAAGQSLPKVRMAYTSIAIQFTPVYLMKELDLPRKQGLNVDFYALKRGGF